MNNCSSETLARSAVYELLSLGFLYPEGGTVALLREGAQALRESTGRLGWSELSAALDGLNAELEPLTDQGMEREYVRLFGHTISTDCPPYETEYGQAHVFQKSQTLADLGAFYEAFGVGVNPHLKERLDHISIEMEFMNLIILKEAYAHARGHGEDKTRLCRQAQQRFLANHLAGWIGSFVHKLDRRTASAGIFAALGRVLDLHLAAEFQRFGLIPESLDLQDDGDLREEEPDCAACPLASDMPQEIRML